MRHDIRFAIRIFRKNPAFAAIAIGTIALGIGANTAIFSVVHAVLLQPLPYANPAQLVTLSEKQLASPGLDRLSTGTARDLIRRSRTLAAISLYGDGGGGRLLENGEAEVLRGQRVSPNFFHTLGVGAEIGRTFVADDCLPGRNDIVVLSHALWKRRFGGDPAVVGRALHMRDRLVRVVGVLPPTFHPLHMSNPGEIPQVFQPFNIEQLESDDRRSGTTAIARLKPSVTPGQARAELNAILHHLVLEYPEDYPRDASLLVERLDERLTGKLRRILWVLLGAVGFVLLITCANVANLLLVRANARSTELALRSALGCSRWRLVRQFLTESMALSMFGGLAGILIAWAATAALVAAAPSEIPRADEIHMDIPVLIFAVLTSLLTGLLFGAAPALRAARLDWNEILRGSRDSLGGRSSRGFRDVLVIAEIACAFVLALGAGLLGRSLDRILRLDVGYDPHRILTMTAFVYDDTEEKRLVHYRQIVERVRAIPGVESAAMVSTVPLSQPVQNTFYVEGRSLPHESEAPVVDQYFATPDYFHVMRIPLRRGRAFTDRDGPHAPPVAIVSESCARAHFQGEDPIGLRIRLGALDGDGSADWMTVVGIVGDVWQHGMDDGPSAGVYAPQAQHPEFYYRLLARTAGDPWRVFPAVRTALRQLDPNAPMFHVQPMDDYVTKSLAERIFALSLIGMLGALALLLAAVGIYGVVSYTVSRRTREFGIRIALGAGRNAVLRLVLRDLLVMLGWGLAAGCLAMFLVTRFLAHLLYYVQASDPLAIISAAAILSSVALAAAVVPCRRALSISPAAALRE